MCYPKPGPRCSKHTEEALRNAESRLKRSREENDDKQIIKLEDKIKELKKSYLLTTSNIKSLRKKAKQENDPRLAVLANKFEEQRKQAIADYKYNKDNAYPSAFFETDYDTNHPLDEEDCERFSFALVEQKGTTKMLPSHHVESEVLKPKNLLFNTMKPTYFKIISSNDREASFYKIGFGRESVVIDDDLLDSYKKWSSTYDSNNDSVNGMTPRSEIYEDLKNYSIDTINLRQLKEKATTQNHIDMVNKVEKDLQTRRSHIISTMDKNTHLNNFLNEKHKELDTEDQKNAEDDEFMNKLNNYLSRKH